MTGVCVGSRPTDEPSPEALGRCACRQIEHSESIAGAEALFRSLMWRRLHHSTVGLWEMRVRLSPFLAAHRFSVAAGAESNSNQRGHPNPGAPSASMRGQPRGRYAAFRNLSPPS